MIELIHGDCLKKLKELAENSVDSIVTDPPYGLKFMGKKWDYEVPSIDIWKEALRVLKPGGHLLSFGGTRTYHRMVANIEDAGFEIRDQIAWLYGQGFPKSTNVLKSGLKQGIFCDCESNTKREMRPLSESDVSETFDVENEQRQVLQSRLSEQSSQEAVLRSESKKSASTREKSSMEGRGNLQKEQGELHRTEICEMPERVPSDGQDGWLCDGTPINNGQTFKQNSSKSRSGSSQRPQHEKQSDSKSRIIPEQSSAQTCGSCGKALCDSGLGSALKPANEPIAVARKPLEKGLTVAENVIKWGCGAINIDGSRIGYQSEADKASAIPQGKITTKTGKNNLGAVSSSANGASNEIELDREKWASEMKGRWPANIILDEAAAEMLDLQSGVLKSGKLTPDHKIKAHEGFEGKSFKMPDRKRDNNFGGDSGGASRFFYIAKASKSERNAGLDGMPLKESGGMTGTKDKSLKTGSGNERDNLNQNFHPTVKPIKLMQYLINLVTPPQGTVLDPFMGSGSTGVAAKNLNRKFIGIELNEEYFEIAKKRIENCKQDNLSNGAEIR